MRRVGGPPFSGEAILGRGFRPFQSVAPARFPLHGSRSFDRPAAALNVPQPADCCWSRWESFLPAVLIWGLSCFPSLVFEAVARDRTIRLDDLGAERSELIAVGPDEDQLLASLVTLGIGLGEQKRAQAAFLFRAAAHHGHLSGFENDAHGKVGKRLFRLTVVDLELLSSVRGGVRNCLVRALHLPMMDLGSEAQRDRVAPSWAAITRK